MRLVIAIHPRNDPFPRWLARLFGMGVLLMLSLAGVCLAIVLYAIACVALGIG